MRVSGGDLCIRKYAEAPTEPAGETLPAPQNFIKLLRADEGIRPYGVVRAIVLHITAAVLYDSSLRVPTGKSRA